MVKKLAKVLEEDKEALRKLNEAYEILQGLDHAFNACCETQRKYPSFTDKLGDFFQEQVEDVVEMTIDLIYEEGDNIGKMEKIIGEWLCNHNPSYYRFQTFVECVDYDIERYMK